MAQEYVLLRLTNMRGVNLSIFDFDYDLSWYAFFLTSDGAVLGRFGGRDADTPGKYLTLSGLRHSLEESLGRFRTNKLDKPAQRKPIQAEDYPGAAKLADNACIHCHHIHEFQRDALQRAKRWSLDNVWIYPQPENLGLTLDAEQGNRIVSVKPGSAVAKVGMKANDVLRTVQNLPISSVADLQNALQHGPKKGALSITWRSGAANRTEVVELAENWRNTDISWRWSLKSMSPNPSIIGDDLNSEERKKFGLDPRQLAYRQMNFLTPTARHAGLQANDVIVGLNDRPLAMTARQFEAHIRLYCQVGQEITLNVLRGKERVKLKLKLPE